MRNSINPRSASRTAIPMTRAYMHLRRDTRIASQPAMARLLSHCSKLDRLRGHWRIFSKRNVWGVESTVSGNSTRQPLCCLTAKRLKPRHACKRFPGRLCPMVVVQQSSINSRSSTVSETTRILSIFQNTGRIATSGFESDDSPLHSSQLARPFPII